MASAPLKAGDAAPDFRLPGDSGRDVTLASFAGRKLVLYFYPKDDTSGCTKEAIDFNALRADFADAGTEVVGVSPDSVKSHEAFKSKYDLAITLGSDETKATCEAYGVWVEKNLYGKKSMGTERSTFVIGPDGHIKEIFRRVKPEAHAEQVLEALKK